MARRPPCADLGTSQRDRVPRPTVVRRSTRRETDGAASPSSPPYVQVGDTVQAVVQEVSPAKQKLSLSLRDYVKRVQREEMDKYIHDESKQDTVSLGDMLKDKIKS